LLALLPQHLRHLARLYAGVDHSAPASIGNIQVGHLTRPDADAVSQSFQSCSDTVAATHGEKRAFMEVGYLDLGKTYVLISRYSALSPSVG
jgi:hypothetical protein